MLRIVSFATQGSHRSPAFELPLAELVSGWAGMAGMAGMCKGMTHDRQPAWHATNP